MLRVFVVDDHAIVREGLKQILSETPDMVLVGEATDGQQLLDRADKGHWDVVLLDIAMPGKNGLDVLVELKHKKPHVPVLVFSMYPERQYALWALRAGASGYLMKSSGAEELTAAIRKVSQGGMYLTSAIAEDAVFEQFMRQTGGSFNFPSD